MEARIRGVMMMWRGGVLGLALGLAWSIAPVSAQLDAEGAPVTLRFVEYPATQEVEGEELYKEARDALNRRDYEDARTLFQQLRRRFPESVLVGDSYYYEAFALYRMASDQGESAARASYDRATVLIETQAKSHPEAATRRDAQSLRARIDGALARGGDANAQRAVGARAQEACNEEADETRVMALSALMNMDPARARPLLREVIADRGACNGEMRAQAVFLLAQNDDDTTVDLLLDLAHGNPDPDPEVRSAAVFWLSQVRRPEAVDALLTIASGDDPELVEGALFALSQHDDPRAYDHLLNLLRTSSDPEVRGQAIFAVSQHGKEEALPVLRAIALDESEDPELRGQAIFWLGQSGGSHVELARIYRGTTDAEVREQTIFAIAQKGTTEAVDFLMEVARSDEDEEMRSKAIFWLGQSKDPRVASFLLELIRG